MMVKNKFQQQQLWMPQIAPDGVELPAGKRRELIAALADLLWQFASVSVEREITRQPGGYDEPPQDHA